MKFTKPTGIFAAASAFALAACGGGAVDADADGDGEVTAEEMEAASSAMGEQMKPQPGQYRATVNFIEADFPGAPEGFSDMLGSQFSNTTEFCMTEEMAGEGFGEAMQQGNQSDNCTVSKMTVDDGQMDMAMTCNDPQAGEVAITMSGSVSPTESDVTMSTEGTFGPMGAGSMTMNVKQERIGDCEG